MSSFGSTVTTTTSESIQPSQQSYFGIFSQAVGAPSFGFGASSAPVLSFQPTQSVFGQSAVTCHQQATVQPSPFLFAAANSSPFVFGAQHSAPTTTTVFSLGKRPNFDGVNGDGNKRQARGLCSAIYFEFVLGMDGYFCHTHLNVA